MPREFGAIPGGAERLEFSADDRLPAEPLIPGEHNRDDYDLSSAGPDGVEGTADDITNWK